MDDQIDEQSKMGAQQSQANEQPPQTVSQSQSSPDAKSKKDDGMGWYKFLIYFALFAGAVWNLVIGILYISGAVYDMTEASADLVYRVFPSLQAVDIIYGISCMALAVYAIFVRFMLAKFKKRSLICLYLLYCIVIFIEIVYYIIAANIINASIADVMDAQSIMWLIWQIVFLVGSIVYFSKRKDMFVN